MTLKVTRRGEIRGQTKLVKITEDVRKFAAEQKLSEDDALRAGMEQKSREFSESGSEIYSKA
jgi:phosphomethylpyrimidine synthase